MALITCPECGKQISDKAPACIHCGCPLDQIAKEEIRFEYDDKGLLIESLLDKNTCIEFLKKYNNSFNRYSEFNLDHEIKFEYYESSSLLPKELRGKYTCQITINYEELWVKLIYKEEDTNNCHEVLVKNSDESIRVLIIPYEMSIEYVHCGYFYPVCCTTKESFNNLMAANYLLRYLVKEETEKKIEEDKRKTEELRQKRLEEQRRAEEELNKKKEKKEAFRKRFMSNYPCNTCGSVNNWYDVDLDIYNDETFVFSASCLKCDGLGYAHGDINTYTFSTRVSTSTSTSNNSSSAPWDTKYYNYPCPYCGKYKVRTAKWEDKQFSTAFWGLFSQKLHSNYKCDNCKRMWE